MAVAAKKKSVQTGPAKKQPAAAKKEEKPGKKTEGSGDGDDDKKPLIKGKKPEGDGKKKDDKAAKEGEGDDDSSKKKKKTAAAEDEGGGDDDDSGEGDDEENAEGDGDQEGDGDDEGDGGDGGDGEAGDDEDWRVTMAAGDEKFLARLKRFTSLEAFGKSFQEAEKKAREKSGGQLAPPADDATPEDWAKYTTEALGRPEKIEDVEITPDLPDGEDYEDDERTLVGSVVSMAFQSGAFGKKQLQVLGQIATDLVIGGRLEMGKRVEAAQKTARAALEKAWGKGEVEKNLEYANSYAAMRCEQAGVDSKELSELRLQDGSRLGDNVLFAQVMALGGRDHHEDPGMLRDDTGGLGVAELRKKLDAEMAKMNGTNAEKKEYHSEAAKKLRADLRAAIKRGGGRTTGPAKGGGKK